MRSHINSSAQRPTGANPVAAILVPKCSGCVPPEKVLSYATHGTRDAECPDRASGLNTPFAGSDQPPRQLS